MISMSFPLPVDRAPVRLPPDAALSRSWVRDQLDDLLGWITFGALLKRLAPDVFAALPDRSKLSVYSALLQHLATLFPIMDSAFFGLDEIAEGDDSGYWYEGIPVEPMGVDLWEGETDSLSLACCFVADNSGLRKGGFEGFDGIFAGGGPLSPYADLLEVPFDIKPRYLKAPRGRCWLEPWQHVEKLFRYAINDTPWNWLNASYTSLAESNSFPPWEVDEIRALAKSWQGAQPYLKDVDEILAYIDGRPRERIPLLIGILRHEREALDEVTYRPRRHAGKRLAEVWA